MQNSPSAIPNVSFIMAAHDAAPWIEAAVASALAQNGVSVEVVVVDDASRDDTAARVAALAAADPRVILLRQEHSGGPSVARNLALNHARGDWIAVLDADDLVDADRSRVLLALAAESGCAVVADNVLRFDDDDPSTAWPQMPVRGGALRVDLAEYLRRNRMTGGDTNLGYLKPLFARALLEANGIRYDEHLRIGEDFHFCLRCLAAGAELAITPQPLYRYRVLAGSLSRKLGAPDLRKLLAAHDAFLATAGILELETALASEAYHRGLLDMLAYVDFRVGLDRRDWSGTLRRALQLPLWRALAEVGCRSLVRRFARQRAARRAIPA